MNRIKDALTRKIGPLPAFVWLGLFAVGVYIYRKKHPGSPTAAAPQDQATPDLSNVPAGSGTAPQDVSGLSTDTSGAPLDQGAGASGGMNLGDVASLIDSIGGLLGGLGGGGGGGGGGLDQPTPSDPTQNGTQTTKKGTTKKAKTKHRSTATKTARPRAGGSTHQPTTRASTHRPVNRTRPAAHPSAKPSQVHIASGDVRNRVVKKTPPARSRGGGGGKRE